MIWRFSIKNLLYKIDKAAVVDIENRWQNMDESFFFDILKVECGQFWKMQIENDAKHMYDRIYAHWRLLTRLSRSDCDVTDYVTSHITFIIKRKRTDANPWQSKISHPKIRARAFFINIFHFNLFTFSIQASSRFFLFFSFLIFNSCLKSCFFFSVKSRGKNRIN